MPPLTNIVRPRILIVEDGHEYIDRFNRFWGTAYDFVRASYLAEAEGHLDPAPMALLLDLDFRRTAAKFLVDEQGLTAPDRSPAENARLMPDQGVLILMALRKRGVCTPAILFADFNDPARDGFLCRQLAPLWVIPSHVGMSEIGDRLCDLATRPIHPADV